MMWYTHAVFGALFYLVFAFVGKILGVMEFNEVFVAVAAFGALFPDIDHPKSYISTKLPIGNVVSRYVEHRGAMHTIEAGVVVSLIVGGILGYIVENYVAILWFFVGYMSHLFADSLTVSGITWSKFKGKPHVRWKVRTGTISEGFVFLPTLFIVIILFFYLSNPEVKNDLLGLIIATSILTYALSAKKAKRLFRNQTVVAKRSKKRR
ncbi:metal-dependent hydrolase [Thermococcus sp. CX2]|uniref:metal-dependent hydrolase n=1 Tax=Thermococcus sp. CX2 TaxID=163006 RepID=UPI00143950A1|nr:metal-dependent hydrolase [Thermococcus sp. CX2]NJE84455.1 metal-dependent hydrolase [Thermococcus sp. CX2]